MTERVAQGHALYPQGGTTALDYGGIPAAPGIAIDTRGLNRVIDYPAADMTITVESGVTLGSLRGVLAAENQRLVIDTPDQERATVGGVFATNTCGPRRFGSGRPRDQILGVSFVTSDGALVKGGGRVVKNVAGYDFPRLLTGSMGTLGIVTQLTLKVRPRPETSALVWVPIASAGSLGPALERLNTSGTRPMAIEVLNPPAAKFVGALIGLPTEDWALIVGYEDNASSVAWQVDRLMIELGRTHIVIREGVDAEPLWSALTDFQVAQPGSVRITASLRPSTVSDFLQALDPTSWAVQAHAGSGVVHAHTLAERELEDLGTEIDRLRALAILDGGSLTVPRCPSSWKKRLKVWGDPRPDWVLSERVKRALDPLGVMNPGRFVGTI
ncbi:MAG: FAD-binding oxidoreductase [Isosphaeraceae bacterium]